LHMSLDARLGGGGYNFRANSEAALLRELQTLNALTQQVAARQAMRDAMTDRRRRAIEAREERQRQQKRLQASQLVASLPRISAPNSVPSSSRPSSSASGTDTAMAPEWAQKNHPEDCSICLGRLDEEECTRLSCGHMYHHSCIESWLVNGTGQTLRCPLCNLVLLDEPELNTSDEETRLEDELDELGAGLDAALAAEWLVSAAQHAFVMQMTRNETAYGAGAQAIARRAAFAALADDERALVDASTDSDQSEDEETGGATAGAWVPRAQLSTDLSARDEDEIESTIQQFVREETARMQRDTSLAASQSEGLAGDEPTLAVGQNRNPLQPGGPGSRVESTVELTDEARRDLEALAAADRAVELQTQIDLANREARAAAERLAAAAVEESAAAMLGSAPSEAPPAGPQPDGTYFV
jgi:hypothetical protein